MGSYAEIIIGKYNFISIKNWLSPLLLIFSPEDRFVDEYMEDDEKRFSYQYRTTVKLAKQCLDVTGHRISILEAKFQSIKEEMDITFKYGFEENPQKAFDEFTFSGWVEAVHKAALKLADEGYPWNDKDNAWFNHVSKDNVSDHLVAKSLTFNSSMYFGVSDETIDQWDIFRVILEAFRDDESVILDYSDLVYGGWCEAIPDESEYTHPKTLVLTEGITDSEFISRSLKILYPHLVKYFYFMDFGVMKVNGSVNFLVHYIKAFAGAKISNMIVGLFDNDSAAIDELENLKGIQLPENIRILKLPEIEIARAYPTIGPTLNQNIDINGLACSIELFFGADILKNEDGGFTPIRWTGYKDRIKKYQGEIQDKGKLQERFRNKLYRAERTKLITHLEWQEMIILIESIIHAFD